MYIEFSNKVTTDYDTMHLVFNANHKGNNIKCMISQECLQFNFNANAIGEKEAFISNQSMIFSKAEEIIEMKRFEKDGSIFIRISDFN